MAVDKLPSAPEIARRTLATVNRDNASLNDLATLIARDQALAARLLRIANGAFYAVRGRVTSIPQAVTMLGFARVLGVRQGKRFEVELSGPADEAVLARVAELAGELLANPVIEEFSLREG